MKIISLLIMSICLTSCTLSFTNVSTHGMASDVVRSEPVETDDISPSTTLQIPLTPVP